MNQPTKQELLEALHRFERTQHRECDDQFYSCPMHTGYAGNQDTNYCDCGLADDQKAYETLRRCIESLPEQTGGGEAVCWYDRETGDYSRVQRVGWEPLFLSNPPTSDEKRDAEYQRGYKDGYNRRDDEVKGCLV